MNCFKYKKNKVSNISSIGGPYYTKEFSYFIS